MAANDMAWTRFGKKKDMPGGLWIKCESCGAMLFRKEFEQKLRVCGTCGYHFTLPARDRIELTVDQRDLSRGQDPGGSLELAPR